MDRASVAGGLGDARQRLATDEMVCIRRERRMQRHDVRLREQLKDTSTAWGVIARFGDGDPTEVRYTLLYARVQDPPVST